MERRLKEAMEKHPKTRAPLTEWTFKIKSASLKNPHELRKLDNSVDVIKGKGEHDLYIFNIKENSYGFELINNE
mgnify:CR=1 FL=1